MADTTGRPRTKIAALLLAGGLLGTGCLGTSTVPTQGVRWVPAWGQFCAAGEECVTATAEDVKEEANSPPSRPDRSG